MDVSGSGGPWAVVDRDAIAWGLVGGLSFLVLLTGYELWTGWRARWLVKVGVALVVTVAATVASGLIASQLRDRRRENERA